MNLMSKSTSNHKRKKDRPIKGSRSKSPSTVRQKTDWWNRSTLMLLLQVLAILGAGTWALSPILKGSWYGDDDIYLLNNMLLQDPTRLWKAWFEPGSFIEYYPIEQSVQWLQWKLWGLESARNYLITNLVLHLISALLVFRLFRKLGLQLAWVGGLIFAVHPFFVDTVGASCELKNTLSLPPFLLAMCFYLDFEAKGKRRDYLLALFLFLVAMLCKITMEFFPIVILLYAWWKRAQITWSDVKASLPFFAISLILGLTTLHAGSVYAESTHYVSPAPIHLGGSMERIALAGLCLAFYFGRCFLPVHPMPYYPLWSMEPLTWWMFLPWLGVALAVAGCWARRETWGRPVLFALAFFALGLAPFLGFNEVSYMCLVWVQEHFLYIPIIALIGLVVAGFDYAWQNLPRPLLPAGVAVTGAVMILLTIQTHFYSGLFADRDQLWRYNLRYNPNAWLVRYLLGVSISRKGELDEGTEQLKESIRINPDFCNTYMALAVILYNTGHQSEAIHDFQEALRINPGMDGTRLDLAIALSLANRPAEALDQFTLFLKNHAPTLDSHYYRGYCLEQENRIPEAMTEYQAALELHPGDALVTQHLERLKTLSQKNGVPK